MTDALDDAILDLLFSDDDTPVNSLQCSPQRKPSCKQTTPTLCGAETTRLFHADQALHPYLCSPAFLCTLPSNEDQNRAAELIFAASRPAPSASTPDRGPFPPGNTVVCADNSI